MYQVKPRSAEIPMSEGAMRIVRIAAPLFAAKGFNGLSINDIAAAMGGSKANIFHHFPSKEALYIAVIRWACNEVRAELKQSAADANQGNRLRFVAQQRLLQMFAKPDSVRLILREVFNGESGINRALVADILHQNFATFVDEIRQEQEQGRFCGEVNPAMVAASITALNMFFFQSWTILEQFEEFRHFGSAQECAGAVFDTMAKGLMLK
jgi:TetR/AcrR family transcriptional regulator